MTATEQPAEHAAAPAMAERRGWYRTGAQRHDHWVDCGATALCGQDVPLAAAVVGLHDVEPNRGVQSGVIHVQACPACLDGLIQRLFGVTFRAGDRVTSRELGMTLHGTVERVFLDDEGVPHLDLERFWIRPPADAHEQREREESGIKHWYRRADTCRPFTSKESAMSTTSASTSKKPRSKSASASALPAQEPPAPATWMPGDFVVCRVTVEQRNTGAQTVCSGIIGVIVGTTPGFRVVNKYGEFTVPASDITAQDDHTPSVPLRAGDRVTRRPVTRERFEVMADAASVSAPVQLRDLASSELVAAASRDLRVEHRVRIEDLYADLGVAAPILAAAALDPRPAIPTDVTLEGESMARNDVGDAFQIGMFASAPSSGPGDAQVGAVVMIDPVGRQVALITPNHTSIVVPAGSLRSCTRPPVAPLRAGDLVRLGANFGEPATVYRVQSAEGAGIRVCKIGFKTLDFAVPTSQVFVWRRMRLDDAVTDITGRPTRDADLPFPVSEADLDAAVTVPAAGWWRYGESVGHWIDQGKALCGRVIDGVPQLASSDPADPAFQHNQCRTCVKVMQKRGLIGVSSVSPEAAVPAPDVHKGQAGTAPRSRDGHHLDVGTLVYLKFGGARVVAGVTGVDGSRVHLAAQHVASLTVQAAECRTPAAVPPAAPLWVGDVVVVRPLTATSTPYQITKFKGRQMVDLRPIGTKLPPGTAKTDALEVLSRVDVMSMRQDLEAAWALAMQQKSHLKVGDMVKHGAATLRVDSFGPHHLHLGEGTALDRKTPEAKGKTSIPYHRVSDLVPVDESSQNAEPPTDTEQASVPEIQHVTNPVAAFPIPHIEPFRPGIQPVPWNRLVNSQLNPRKHFDQDSLTELAVNIARRGLKQNLQARPHPGRPGFYEIVAGERRWRAIGLLTRGVEVGEGEHRETLTVPTDYEIPVLLEELTDAELVQAAMSENVQRNNMTPIEVADGFRAMVDGGLTEVQVATIFHRKVKTVTRLVQISRSLVPGLRTLFDEGRLSQAQAELFALAPEPVQEHAEQDIRRTNVVPTVDQIKAFVLRHVFPVHVAQFPPPWYTGRVVEKDLFGDLPAFYADFGQALQLQERHAVALAQKDVERGAAFADVAVRPEAQLWNYEQAAGTGVLYWINAVTGELKRYEGLRSAHTQLVKHHFEAPQPVPVHEAPPATRAAMTSSASGTATEPDAVGTTASVAAPVPTTPPAPVYPARKIAVNGYFQRALDVAQDTPTLLRAVALLGLINEDMRLTPASRAAAVEAARGCGGLLHVDDRGALSVSYDHVPADGPMEAALLPALLALPGDVLDTLLAAHLAAWSEAFLTPDLIFAARHHVPDLPPFQLTEGYLKQCDRPALEELYQDAGLGSTQNTTAGYLRDELLTEAPRLAQSGFLPRPLRGEQP